MSLIQNPSFSYTLPTETGDDLVGAKCYLKADMAGGWTADEIVEVESYNSGTHKYILKRLSSTNNFEVGATALENGTASKAGLSATLDNWKVVNTGTTTVNNDLLSQLALQNDGEIELNQTSSEAYFDLRLQSVPFEENTNYKLTASLANGDNQVRFNLDKAVVSDLVESSTWVSVSNGFQFRTDEDEPSVIRIRLDANETLSFFQITKQENTMSIKSDGSHKFGIEDSPITIDGDTFVAEAMSFNKTGSRADIDDSNGLPLGSTIIPGRVEGSATLQLDGVNAPAVGDEFVLTGGHYAGTYIIQDIGETQSQGDYTKIAVNFYLKLNP